MATELFRRVSSFTTQRGRVAMYHARKNRLAKLVVIKSIILLWNSIGAGIGFGSVTGTGTATGIGEATDAGIGSVTGISVVTGDSGIIESIGSITGTGTATGVGAEV